MQRPEFLSISPDDHHHDLIYQSLIFPDVPIRLSESAIAAVEKGRSYLDKKLNDSDETFYGINTGFGSLCNTVVQKNELEQLQLNLIRSHACGTGELVPEPIVRTMLLLKVKSLCFGHSGIRPETIRRLVDFYNHGITPVVYTRGSLGASGDLAPLAHLSLPILGEGEAKYQGKVWQAADLLAELGWKPLKLASKEGLALLNGTQFMLAYGMHAVFRARNLAAAADAVGAMSLEAFDCRPEPYHPALHRIRPHAGQIFTAQAILDWVEGSELISGTDKPGVQDPYSFRCIPQVHGATKDAIDYVESVFMTEYQSVSDNPNLFPDEDLILSGGNFHGQPLALALDFLTLAVAELGSISERRLYLLLSGKRGLPDFLCAKPGLESGLMILQYTAASIVSDNKHRCFPSSADSIISSNGQEDHVSMGANAAVKCLKVVENVEGLIGMELIGAAQGLDCRERKTSPKLQELHKNFRQAVSELTSDRILSRDIQVSGEFIRGLKMAVSG